MKILGLKIITVKYYENLEGLIESYRIGYTDKVSLLNNIKFANKLAKMIYYCRGKDITFQPINTKAASQLLFTYKKLKLTASTLREMKKLIKAVDDGDKVKSGW